jgi:hypothetical protein
MNTLKSIYDWTRVLVFFAILLILLVTSISQSIVFYNLAIYSIEQVEPIPLTEEEISSFCSNQSCYYSHKINFDGRVITFDWHGFHYKDKLWVFTRIEDGKKFIEHKEEFLYEYLYFDLFSIVYIFLYITSVRKENKSDPNNSRWKRLLQKKKKKEESDNDQHPLPPFLGIFILGYFQILLGLVISFLSWQYLPHVLWIQFFTPFSIIIALSYILYHLFGKRIGIIGSSFLTLFLSIFSAKDINYIYNITRTDSSKIGQIEQVYTLSDGNIVLENLGVYSEMSYSSSRRPKRSFTYYFVAPYFQKESPEDKTQWLWLKNEWVEDPLQLEIFLQKWKESKLAVQIYEDSPLYAVTVVANYYQIDLSGGFALLKPIHSLKDEIVSKAIPTVIIIFVLLFIWTLLGGLRIYAGRE